MSKVEITLKANTDLNLLLLLRCSRPIKDIVSWLTFIQSWVFPFSDYGLQSLITSTQKQKKSRKLSLQTFLPKRHNYGKRVKKALQEWDPKQDFLDQSQVGFLCLLEGPFLRRVLVFSNHTTKDFPTSFVWKDDPGFGQMDSFLGEGSDQSHLELGPFPNQVIHLCLLSQLFSFLYLLFFLLA